MRILHIGTEKSWRGGENQVRFLIEGLKSRGVESFAAYPETSRAFAKFCELAPTLGLPSRSGYDPRSVIRLIQYCRNHQIELIDAHSSAAMSLALSVKRRLPHIKLVVHRRVDIAIKKNFLTRRKYINNLVDHFVAISAAIENVLLNYGISSHKTSVVRSAVDEKPHLMQNKHAARAKLLGHLGRHTVDGSLEAPLLIGVAAALTKEKGHDVLLRASRELKENKCHFHIFIAGDGAFESELKRLVTEFHLSEQVTFLGHIQNVTEYLAGLDVLVMPSSQEGLGTILLEGAFAGCVLVGSNVGGIPEIIQHDETGLLFQVGDSHELATNLRRLISEKSLREKLKANSLQHVKKEFSLENMVQKNYEVYSDLLNK